jgi:hypothetical protein
MELRTAMRMDMLNSGDYQDCKFYSKRPAAITAIILKV